MFYKHFFFFWSLIISVLHIFALGHLAVWMFYFILCLSLSIEMPTRRPKEAHVCLRPSEPAQLLCERLMAVLWLLHAAFLFPGRTVTHKIHARLSLLGKAASYKDVTLLLRVGASEPSEVRSYSVKRAPTTRSEPPCPWITWGFRWHLLAWRRSLRQIHSRDGLKLFWVGEKKESEREGGLDRIAG